MPDQPFLDPDALIRDIEAKAAEQPDLLAVLIVLLKMVIASDADPGLLRRLCHRGGIVCFIGRFLSYLAANQVADFAP